MKEKESLESITLADDVEYIIIQRENPDDIYDETGEIIALITHDNYKIASGYMLRTKYREISKKD